MKSKAATWRSAPHPSILDSPQQRSLPEKPSPPFRDQPRSQLACQGGSRCRSPNLRSPMLPQQASSPYLGTTSISARIILCDGPALCIAGWVAASLVSTQQVSVAPPSTKPRMSPSTAKCPETQTCPWFRTPAYSAGALGRPMAARLKIRFSGLIRSQTDLLV